MANAFLKPFNSGEPQGGMHHSLGGAARGNVCLTIPRCSKPGHSPREPFAIELDWAGGEGNPEMLGRSADVCSRL